MSDEVEAPDQPKDRSDVLFFGIIGILMVAIFGGAAYFLGAFDGSDTKAPDAGPNEASRSQLNAVHARFSKKDALAVVEKSTRLTLAGQYRAACALESPAYRRFDAGYYPQGSCAAASKAVMDQVAAQGLSVKVTSAKLTAFTPGEATAVVSLSVGSTHRATRVYLRYHGTKWWITGGDDSGDLGY